MSFSKPLLYSFWFSSCSWRVRAALSLKGIEYEYKAVNLLEGEQHKDEHGDVNTMKQVPALQIGDDVITQSLPIIEYLEETHPKPALLPSDPIGRAKVRGMAEMIASGIQPHHNLGPIKYIQAAAGDDHAIAMPKHFISLGFDALERAVKQTGGQYCYGNEVTLADLCLVPQVYSATLRFQVDMASYPTIDQIYTNLIKLPAFIQSHPQNQPDCPTKDT